jgi:Flp pilus assembly protein TadD
MRFLLALCALLVALPSAARAEWFESSSAHFVVYADVSERDVRAFSEQLERYHAAMELVTGLKTEPPSPSNRVTVFMVRNQREIQRLASSRNVGGFYIPRAGGSVAFVPRVEVRNGQPGFWMIALLHEYAHHFLLSNSGFPSPRWFAEGGAEFFASSDFGADGSIGIGMPALHRGWELAVAHNVRVAELVDPEAYEKRRGNSYDAFYGKSWLLYHYLVFTPERHGQLRDYVRAMTSGKSSRQAAEQVFGDPAELEHELQRYRQQRTMLSLRFKPEQLEIAPIALRRISQGEAEMMPVRVRSRRGVTREEALEILADARKVAAGFPNDAAVLAALAEAEYDAGNDAEAIAAADKALAIDPGQVNAYMQKGYALFRRAGDADDRDTAYKDAVAPFLALNRLEPDHPIALIYFYRSFVARGRTPSANAVQALERAAELAPYDLDLRVDLAVQQLTDGRLDQARANLVPVAYSPHPNAMAKGARAVIDRIDEGGATEPEVLLQLLREPPKSEAQAAAPGD